MKNSRGFFRLFNFFKNCSMDTRKKMGELMTGTNEQSKGKKGQHLIPPNSIHINDLSLSFSLYPFPILSDVCDCTHNFSFRCEDFLNKFHVLFLITLPTTLLPSLSPSFFFNISILWRRIGLCFLYRKNVKQKGRRTWEVKLCFQLITAKNCMYWKQSNGWEGGEGLEKEEKRCARHRKIAETSTNSMWMY